MNCVSPWYNWNSRMGVEDQLSTYLPILSYPPTYPKSTYLPTYYLPTYLPTYTPQLIKPPIGSPRCPVWCRQCGQAPPPPPWDFNPLQCPRSKPTITRTLPPKTECGCLHGGVKLRNATTTTTRTLRLQWNVVMSSCVGTLFPRSKAAITCWC